MPFNALDCMPPLNLKAAALVSSSCQKDGASVYRSSVTLLERIHWVMSIRKIVGLLFGEGIYEMTVHRRVARRRNRDGQSKLGQKNLGEPDA